MRKPLVEDARLNREGSLRGRELFFESVELAQGERTEPEGDEKRQQPRGNGNRTDGNQQSSQADARSVERDDFAVGGHAAEADQNAYESGHGQSERQNWYQ